MESKSLTALCFSATGTTLTCVETVAHAMGMPVKNAMNLADNPDLSVLQFDESDVLLIGAPVYGGRIPTIMAEEIKNIQGNGAKTIAMVVYGNRDYDDALLELTDLLRDNGFKVMAAAAFIARHSIFPKVGTSRPDTSDTQKLTEFGTLCRSAIAKADTPELPIKGNRPYKKYSGVPLHPAADRDKCNGCGKCATLCPTGAISASDPLTTDNTKCITCSRCIATCPNGARSYKGLKYSMIGKIFVASYSKRKEPELFL